MGIGDSTRNSYYTEGTEGNCYGTEKVMKQLGPFAYNAKTSIDGLAYDRVQHFVPWCYGSYQFGNQYELARILGVKKPNQLLKSYLINL
ncbi:MAG: hypothetical protein R2769_09825 [Saprospiraceae bacterium]